MHSTDTKSQFLELRAKGWSLTRIASHLQVGTRTLVDWNRQHHVELQTFRTIELEALQEKLIASHEHELTRLTQHLGRVEAELAKRDLDLISTEQLYRLTALLRSEIRRATLKPDFDRDPFPSTNPPPKS